MSSSNKDEYFNELKDVTLGSVVKIFSKGKIDISELIPKDDKPVIIILAGSPGVGKTTTAKKLIPLILGDKYSYNNFYNISLDSLVERVKPYRKMTSNLYNEILSKKGRFNNENTQLLSNAYLPLIMSTSQDFNLNKTRKKLSAKIHNITNIKINKSVRNKTVKSLNNMREEGFIFAANNGLNILYDTTLTPLKDKIKKDILRILQKSKYKYKIITILIKADEETIKERIRGRHNAMLKENNPYIRSVSIPAVKNFIKDNEEAFNKSLKNYENNTYINSININKNINIHYNSKDFTFYRVHNLEGKDPIIEQVTSKTNIVYPLNYIV